MRPNGGIDGSGLITDPSPLGVTALVWCSCHSGPVEFFWGGWLMISVNLGELMGGYGSGKAFGMPTTSDLPSIDLRMWHREGLFCASSKFGLWTWRSAGRVVASIGYEASRAAVVLDYEIQGERIRYAVPIEWTRCNYGGERPWFRCPDRGCGRRCAILYGGRFFSCRRCLGLVYQSQREDRSTRLMRKADKLRAKLGTEPSEDVEDKPPRMHWATFDRLVGDIERANYESLMSVGGLFGRLLREKRG
jgi:hypothetical protein